VISAGVREHFNAWVAEPCYELEAELSIPCADRAAIHLASREKKSRAKRIRLTIFQKATGLRS
jgi:hypothetical protein